MRPSTAGQEKGVVGGIRKKPRKRGISRQRWLLSSPTSRSKNIKSTLPIRKMSLYRLQNRYLENLSGISLFRGPNVGKSKFQCCRCSPFWESPNLTNLFVQLVYNKVVLPIWRKTMNNQTQGDQTDGCQRNIWTLRGRRAGTVWPQSLWKTQRVVSSRLRMKISFALANCWVKKTRPSTTSQQPREPGKGHNLTTRRETSYILKYPLVSGTKIEINLAFNAKFVLETSIGSMASLNGIDHVSKRRFDSIHQQTRGGQDNRQQQMVVLCPHFDSQLAITVKKVKLENVRTH